MNNRLNLPAAQEKRRQKRSYNRMEKLEKVLKTVKFKQGSQARPSDFVTFQLVKKSCFKGPVQKYHGITFKDQDIDLETQAIMDYNKYQLNAKYKRKKAADEDDQSDTSEASEIIDKQVAQSYLSTNPSSHVLKQHGRKHNPARRYLKKSPEDMTYNPRVYVRTMESRASKDTMKTGQFNTSNSSHHSPDGSLNSQKVNIIKLQQPQKTQQQKFQEILLQNKRKLLQKTPF